jgi:NAD(P)-dependent dehydrogenase (short-subunit alcohol dehydrogenase family)
MSKAVAKRLVAAKRGGSIINISSIAGLERSLLPGGFAYGISKAGVIHLSKVRIFSSRHLHGFK